MLRLLVLAALLLALPSALAQAPLTLASTEPVAGGNFGRSVAGIGDVNGDGRSDVVVTAPGYASTTGRAYVLSGATGASLRTIITPNPRTGGNFGIALGRVPDADGDGIDDFVVGAQDETGSATALGRAHLFSGATGALLWSVFSPNGENPNPVRFGQAVAGVPDVDGDGRGDFVVGACLEDAGATDAGRVYVFSGATGVLLHTIVSPAPEQGGQLGTNVAGIGDIDGDGRGDIVATARSEDGSSLNNGRVYVFSGATGTLIRTHASPNPGSTLFGNALADVGDLNGDGRPDLLVGAYVEPSPLTGAGRVYLYSGATGTLIRTLLSPTPEESGGFGTAVAGVPDVDGDGRVDLLVGTQSEDGGAVNAGKAHLFSGATGLLIRSVQSLNPDGTGPLGFFGRSVAGVDDMDGDGRGDLLIGAYQEDGGASGAGRAYLFSGATGVAVEPGATAPGLALSVAPNPAYGVATLTLSLDQTAEATVAVYDLLGRRVAALHDGLLAAGEHRLTFDAALPAGVYLARVVTNGGVLTHRVAVAR